MTRIFATYTEIKADTEARANHGQKWSEADLEKLLHWFDEGHCLQLLCYLLERPAAGVISKLQAAARVHYEQGTYSYVYVTNPKSQSYSFPKPLKETTMNADNLPKAPTLEVKTFICGADAAQMSDEEIFTLIGKKETEIKRWELIVNKPAKLNAMIAAVTADVAKLVKYVDERDTPAK
jgi:hypothetical protein